MDVICTWLMSSLIDFTFPMAWSDNIRIKEILDRGDTGT